MAKGENNEVQATTDVAPATTPTVAVPPQDNRRILLNVPEGDPSGLSGQQPRADVIRALAATGNWERGAIAKHITSLQFTPEQIAAGHKVAYQIVFQATKGMAGVKASPRGAAAPVVAPAPTGENPPA